MSQSYEARTMFSSDREKEVAVLSKRCRYHAWINKDEVTLFGPGVNEVVDRESLPDNLPAEDLAIHIVLLFENGLWPSED